MITHQFHVIRIGGLVVNLAVAIDIYDIYESASPGFDSRPMHFGAEVDFPFSFVAFLAGICRHVAGSV